MSEILVGNSRRLTVIVKNIERRQVDPGGLTLQVKKPGGAWVTYTYGIDVLIVKDSAGAYHADFYLDIAGTWNYKWTGTGENAFTRSRSFYVKAA